MMVPMMMPVVMPMMVPAPGASNRRRGDGDRDRRRKNVTQLLHVDLRGLNNRLETRMEAKSSRLSGNRTKG
jgi:hypothetical protein